MLSILSQAWQSWKAAKGIALLAIIALAVGIGSTTAIYTVIDAVMLKPLPYRDGDRFVALYGARSSEPKLKSSLTYAELLDYQARTHSFDVFGWFAPDDFNLSSPGEPQHLEGVAVTPTLAGNLGVNPVRGRWFRSPSNEPTGAYAAVISNSLWHRLGADPDIVGKAITLNDRRYTVMGVMPGWFILPVLWPSGGGPHAEIWVPLDPHGKEQDRSQGIYFCYARLKPGVTFRQAESDVKHVAAQIAREHPESHGSDTARLESLRDVVSSDIKPTLLLLLAAAGLLLLITCANVAGLLVARSVSRARETAVRVALGAAQRQLVSQYFAEGLLVSIAGAALGVGLSWVLVRAVITVAADYIPRADEITLNWTIVLVAVLTGCLTSMLCSLAPLWQALRTAPNEVLSDGVRASASMRSRRLSQSLVITEIALAFTLLAVSATFIAQLNRLSGEWPGFDPNHLLTFQLTASETQYPDSSKLVAYQKKLLRALQGMPGISSAAFVNQVPLNGCCYSTTIFPDGRTLEAKAAQRVSFLPSSPGYFRTMKIPLLQGRVLNEHDTGENPLLADINQAAARYYWPGQNAVGRYGRLSTPNGSRFQVVGVAGDVRNSGLGDATVPEIYLLAGPVSWNPMHFVVRSPLAPSNLLAEIRGAIRAVDPGQPIYDVQTVKGIIRDSVALQRVSSLMTGFFACSALLMATLGIYGVVAYSVRQRTVEIGTRMAFGAVGSDILRLVVGGGLKMAVYAMAIGAAAIAIAVWLLTAFSIIRTVDPMAFVSSTAIVAGVAAAASFFPAWRASLLSPMVAIRNEPSSMWQSTQRGFKQALAGVSRLVSRDDEEADVSSGRLLTEFVDATRRAETFADALTVVLSTLRERFRSEAIMLFENSGGDEYHCVAAAPPASASEGQFPANGFLVRRLRSYSSPLPITESDFDTWLRWANEQNGEHANEIQSLRKTGARLAVALRTKNEILGVLLLGEPVGRSEYSLIEKEALRSCAEQLALMLENARLTGRVVEQEKLRRDLSLAAEVQKRLLPEKSPQTALGALAAFSLPARSVGGDYYDFLQVGEHRIGIALADVAGKGIAAALIMSVLQASLRILSSDGGLSLPEIVAKMNRFLYRSTGSNSYATFFYAQVDEESRQLHYVNAGHNPPYLLRSGRATENGTEQIEELSAGGMIIGLFPHANYEETKVDLRSGDVLVIFTDGVTEALNPSAEEFGEDRLKDLIRRVAPLSVEDMSRQISQELRNWISDADQYDDLTFVVMKVS